MKRSDILLNSVLNLDRGFLLITASDKLNVLDVPGYEITHHTFQDFPYDILDRDFIYMRCESGVPVFMRIHEYNKLSDEEKLVISGI